ncbi:MAG TPA: protein kinase [Gemmataceae bacterium]|nr:protein kinase [Gemmataceae bacterium]
MESWPGLLATELPPEHQERLEKHLERCAPCQERLHRAEVHGDPLLEVARKLGDPTTLATDRTLAEALERIHQEVKSPLRSAAPPIDLYFLEPTARPELLGTIGRYEVREVIGHGGMGIVLMAYEPSLHRMVAIKVMSPALAGSARARQRFTREVKAAAAVSHDHIVTVHGVSEVNGLPYMVMQYVAGESLQARLDRLGTLELTEVLRIGLQTASALAAAHAQGLIHRDIKPANLLLENGLARVKITDFGLARMVDDVQLTQSGVVAGTPEYMAPEQARGDALDHRADLFSLGSVLYAMCTGRPPFCGSTAFSVLRQVADQPARPVRSVNAEVPAWLETVIGRLMANDPDERFQSAAEVATLLENFLAHLRQPASVSLPELPVLVLPACEEREQETKPAQKRLRRRWFSSVVRQPPGLVVCFILAAVGLSACLLLMLATFGGQGGPVLANPNRTDEGVWTLAFSPDGRRLVTAGGDHSHPGQLQIWDVAGGKPLVTLRESPGMRTSAYSPDGQMLATGHWDGEIKLRDPLTGAERATLTGHAIGVNGLAFSADGTQLASAGLDRTVRLWDVKTLQERQVLLGHQGMVFSVGFFRHGGAIVSGGDDATARIWDLNTGKERLILKGHETAIEAVALSREDRLVVTGSQDGTIRFWDAATGTQKAVARQPAGAVLALALSSSGELLASAASDGAVHLWDTASQKLLKSVKLHRAIARAVAFSPDGKLLASGGEDKKAQLWDVSGVREPVLATSPEGKLVGDLGEKGVRTFSAARAAASLDASENATPATRSTAWLAAAVVIFGLLCTLALATWLYRRARSLPSAPGQGQAARYTAIRIAAIAKVGDENIQPQSSEAPLWICFPCSGCGKTLKVKAEWAGKKGKCSQCGKESMVPQPMLERIAEKNPTTS